MKCIAGLGNPGKKYADTRHNIGFMIIDELAGRHNWTLKKDKFKGKSTVEMYNGEKVILLAPQTFMNASGESIKPLMDFYKLAPEDLLVIYDDLDLPAGKIRLRFTGGHGGHNGIRSVIDQLGTKDFNRLRIGIGKPDDDVSVVDYVLRSFSRDQKQDVQSSIKTSADACDMWLRHPFYEVMNTYNG